MANYDENNDILQMSQFIKDHKINYISEFVDYCLSSNPKWYEMIVDNRRIQYTLVLLLESIRADNTDDVTKAMVLFKNLSK